jgi:hypothetical protein
VVTFATVHASDPTAFILGAVLDLNEAFQLLLAKSRDIVISLQVKGGGWGRQPACAPYRLHPFAQGDRPSPVSDHRTLLQRVTVVARKHMWRANAGPTSCFSLSGPLGA